MGKRKWTKCCFLIPDNCDESCFGILASSHALVCSGHGSCIAQDVCQCSQNYTGLNCSIPLCNSIPATNTSVCNGRGICIANNTCNCTSGAPAGGSYCSAPVNIVGDDISGRKYSDNTYARSCKEYINSTLRSDTLYVGSIGSGIYWIQPDTTPFKVTCEMSVNGGVGLTSINSDVQSSSLNTLSSLRYYYYVKDVNTWYKSPPSTIVWNWSSFTSLSGDYSYTTNNGQTMSSFNCAPNEDGFVGVGCSNGPYGTFKVVTTLRDTSTGHLGTVCQDQPNIFKSICLINAYIYLL